MSNKAMIAMSGGVDSSVAAWLTKQAGFDCTGATMRLFTTNEPDDAAEAQAVAERLGLPHLTFDFAAEFRQQVMDKFAAAYEQGQTPNPCISCNRQLKFGRLLEEAQHMGFSHLATGHYARIEYDQGRGRWLLKKALDAGKDQSYVLFGLTQQQLACTLLPLGELTKAQVRQIAEQQSFANAHKRESQDICFVPDGDYAAFIQQHTGHSDPPGDFVNKRGQVLGRHRGLIHYTLGQRHGMGLALGRPAYVCGLCPQQNTVQVGFAEDLYIRGLRLREINLITVPELNEPQYFAVKMGYRRREQPALVQQTGPDELLIQFVRPQRTTGIGQAAVIYAGQLVVGGGLIAETLAN